MNIRNVAVIAHVDHGKTTLVDFILKQSNTFRENEAEMQQTTILDSNPLERERGITILAKNTAISYKNYRINIIDTPGHADFSGEVERTLNMADGALLIVDVFEGPMPQTKFVLKKALELNLKIIVVINKVDKKLADANATLEATNDLFLELATSIDQLNFPVFYAIGREGKASEKIEDVSQSTTLAPLMQSIIDYIPSPKVQVGKFQMVVSALDYDSHKGKHVIGRVSRGTLEKGQKVVLLKENGEKIISTVDSISINQGLKKLEVNSANAGEIVEFTGVGNAVIGDTITDPTDPTPLPRIVIEEPTIKIAFFANTSPFAGKEGKFSNSRQLYERLTKELETNVSLRLEIKDDKFIVAGRGELHLSILIETLRREGYEFQVGKPEVITRVVDGVKMEPVEDLIIDVPDEFQGVVTKELGERKGKMTNMQANGKGMTRFEYKIPSKNLLGIRNILLTSTRGTALINSLFDKYEPLSPPIPYIRNGALTASETGVSVAYGLLNAQGRGVTFITPGTKVYEGMVVGQNSRKEDIEINVAKEKKQTNVRSETADIVVPLSPPVQMSLEQYLDFLAEDELLEVTPQNLRLRKKYLSKLERVRHERKEKML